MLEFGVEVTTGELVAVERALRGLDTDAARSAMAKAHRAAAALTVVERDAVLSALRIVLEDPAAVGSGRDGLARLAAKLEHEHEHEAAADEPPARPSRPRKA
jgi:hypothetical protein